MDFRTSVYITDTLEFGGEISGVSLAPERRNGSTGRGPKATHWLGWREMVIPYSIHNYKHYQRSSPRPNSGSCQSIINTAPVYVFGKPGRILSVIFVREYNLVF